MHMHYIYIITQKKNRYKQCIDHQLKLIDSKCRFSAEAEAHTLATSCLIVLGPQTATPTSDPLQSRSIPANQLHTTQHQAFSMSISQEKWKNIKQLNSLFRSGRAP